MPPRYVIGLTGNIASGKSLVADLLRQRGAEVIDADQVAHEVLAAGTPETQTVRERFGPEVIAADGSVDRAALGRIVFRSPSALAELEAIVHPSARKRILDRLRSARAEVAVIEAIKLLEGPLVHYVDAVWVVTAPRELRIQRLVSQRGLAPEEAAARVDAQGPEEAKVARADVVIANQGSLPELEERVGQEWARLVRSLAVGPTRP